MSLKRIKLNILLISLLSIDESNSKIKNIKQNILFIIIDDLRYLANETIFLPNMYQMAENGVNFKYAYAQQALCAASRHSILTGRRPDNLQSYDAYTFRRAKDTNFTTMPQLFKKYGYNTYSVGKIFHADEIFGHTDDYPYSWSEIPYHPPTNKYKDSAVCELSKYKKLRKNLVCPVIVAKHPDKTLPDIETLNEAIEVLKQSNNSLKPYFLAVGFHKPHLPIKYPKKYLEKVPISEVRPPAFPNKPTNMPLVAWHPWMDIRNYHDIDRLHILFPMGTIPLKWTLKIRQSYYAAALYIDDLIGTLMMHVDRRNTIIVLTSDHGWSLGENGLWSKYSNFDVALRVPLIFNIPGMKPKSINTPVELLDIFPTLTALASLTKNIQRCKHRDKSKLCFDGKSLVPLMKKHSNNVYTGQPFAFSQYPRPSVKPWGNTCKPSPNDINIMGYSVRTDRYRYTEWVSFNSTTFKVKWSVKYGKELYDHLDDPNESNNVHSDENYSKLVKMLSNLLRTHVKRGVYSFKDLEI